MTEWAATHDLRVGSFHPGQLDDAWGSENELPAITFDNGSELYVIEGEIEQLRRLGLRVLRQAQILAGEKVSIRTLIEDARREVYRNHNGDVATALHGNAGEVIMALLDALDPAGARPAELFPGTLEALDRLTTRKEN